MFAACIDQTRKPEYGEMASIIGHLCFKLSLLVLEKYREVRKGFEGLRKGRSYFVRGGVSADGLTRPLSHEMFFFAVLSMLVSHST